MNALDLLREFLEVVDEHPDELNDGPLGEVYDRAKAHLADKITREADARAIASLPELMAAAGAVVDLSHTETRREVWDHALTALAAVLAKIKGKST